MKLAQRKTFICLFAILMAFAIGLSLTFVKASAEEVSTSDYFKVTGDGSTVYDGTNLVLELDSGSEAKFKRELVLNDFAISLSTDAEVEFTVTYDSNVATGKKVVDGENTTYETSLTQKVTVNGSKVITVYVDGIDLIIDGNAYNDAKIFGGNVVGTIGFVAKADAKISIAYIDQDASDTNGEYKQSFTLTSGAPTSAKSIVLLNESLYNGTDSDIVKVKGQKVAVSFTEYSVMSSGKSASSFKAAKTAENNNGVYVWESGKYVSVDTVNTVETFNVVASDTVYGSFTIKGVEEDVTAPVYKTIAVEVRESFENALNEATYEEYDGARYHIRIGSSNYLTIPTMEDFVSDDYSSYSDMSYTVWYCNDNSSWTSYSGLKVPVASEGVYKFFVLFKDKLGNGMEKSDFLDDDNNLITTENVFEFEIVNDAPLSIKATSQENAYKGISYTASSFTILAKDYTVEYKLMYSENGETAWEEILPLSELEEGTADYKKYADYNYDGSLTFTPAKIGHYEIVANVYEEGTFRTAEASAKIQATRTPIKVVPNESNWLLNNVWSIVFLATGGLSLIGLLVVLCIKPKEENV